MSAMGVWKSRSSSIHEFKETFFGATLQVIRCLLQLQADVNAPGPHGMSAAFLASQRGQSRHAQACDVYKP